MTNPTNDPGPGAPEQYDYGVPDGWDNIIEPLGGFERECDQCGQFPTQGHTDQCRHYQPPTDTQTPATPPALGDDWDMAGAGLIDWPELWATDYNEDNWEIEPFMPGGGRATHIYASRGTGKSELVLHAAVNMATGWSFLDRPKSDPVHVGYVDFEMTAGDLKDRFSDMGVDEATDLTHLHYLLHPDWRHLDTDTHAMWLVAACVYLGIEALFVDSVSAAIAGDENSNDTYQNLFNHTIQPLKAAGISSCWLGNTGKDADRGSRGGSRKEDVFDLIWELKRNADGGSRLVNRKKRSSWIPDIVGLVRVVDPIVEYKLQAPDWDNLPTGTMKAVALLDRLGASTDLSTRAAGRLIRENNSSAGAQALGAAIKWRQGRMAKTAATKSEEPDHEEW